jgi:hypothetical protein
MKRALALASLLALAGCATDGYYTGYSSSYGYGDGYAPYYYGNDRPYAYDAYPYYYGAPAIGGGVYYYDRDRRDGRHRDGDRRRDRRDDRDDGVARAPAERMDPGNMVRPQAPRPTAPSEWLDRNPTSGMTQEESIRAGGR